MIIRPNGNQDPREVLDWGVDWAGVLALDEAITMVTWSAEPAGIGLVLTPLDTVGHVAYAQLEVDAQEQSHERWNDPGVIVQLACEIATTYLREIVRTIPIRLARGVVSSSERVITA